MKRTYDGIYPLNCLHFVTCVKKGQRRRANSEILCQHNGSADTQDVNFYLHDRLGSTRQVINKAGSVVRYYSFDPFGKKLEVGPPLSAAAYPFMFTGQYFDWEIGQYYLRARQYDPILMRLTGRDTHERDFGLPLSLHRYLYCINSPTYYVDLNGEEFSLPGLVTGMAQGAAIGGITGFYYSLAKDLVLISKGKKMSGVEVLKNAMLSMGGGAIAGSIGGITGGWIPTVGKFSKDAFIIGMDLAQIGGTAGGLFEGFAASMADIQGIYAAQQIGMIIMCEADW